MDWSTAFWSVARALATTFFCRTQIGLVCGFDVAGSPRLVESVAGIRSETYLGLLAVLEESLLGLLLSLLLLGEVVGGGDLLEGLLVNSGDVNALGGGDNVAGVDTAEGNAVNLEGTGDKEDTLLEVLEEDDTLAAEATGQEDQDGTGLEALANLSGAESLADLYAQTCQNFEMRKRSDLQFECNWGLWVGMELPK